MSKSSHPIYGAYSFPFQKDHYTGKVREVYSTKDDILAIISTDDISAFDVVMPKPVPYKGVILNLIAAHFLEQAKSILPVWLKKVPHGRVSVGTKAKPIECEIIVRGNALGSYIRNYTNKEEDTWGNKVPKNLREGDFFTSPLVTPTTKDKEGHDEDISWEEIVKREILTQEDCVKVQNLALKLFDQGRRLAMDCGLLLGDTKYEFGWINGEIALMDELHTPDSSRYFYLDGYTERQTKGEKQRHLSKEFFREWLMERGFMGKEGQTAPVITDEVVQEISNRYIELYELLLKKKFQPELFEVKDEKKKEGEIVFERTKIAIGKYRAERDGPKVGIVMGSISDLPVMSKAADTLDSFGISYHLSILSAHRTPHLLSTYAKEAEEKGIQTIIAGAGGAAHLPGMVAAYTALPVVGVPVKSSNSMIGLDSLLSIDQMPPGVPVATMAVDGSGNAGIFAAQILSSGDLELRKRVKEYKNSLISAVAEMNEKVRNLGY